MSAVATDWRSTQQREAKERSESLPLPGPKDEPWRFASIRKAALSEIEHGARVSRPQVEQPSDLPEGVLVLPIEDAAQGEHGELLRRFLLTQEAPLGSEKFRQLHAAGELSGVFVYVPAGVEIAGPIVVEHRVGAGTYLPHTLVVAEANSKVTVIEHLTSVDAESNGFAVGVFDLYAHDGAKIDYLRTQDLNLASRSIAIGTSVVDRDADVRSLLLNLGGTWSRNEQVSHLNGTGANSNMLAASVPDGDQEFDQRTFQHHHAQHTTSDLLFKNALYGTSKSVFGGLILVDEGAHHTDAYQTCRNLLLSDEAEAHSMPGLEINADQVHCSHGATTGQIDIEQIFYLQSRGLPAVEARRLIAQGFALEALSKMGGNEPLREQATAAIEARFARM